jgi:hypothetical protein
VIAVLVNSARRPAGACLGLSIALLALASAARADTAVFPDVKDNTLYETPSGNLSNGAGPVMFAGRTSDPSNTDRRALVRFILPGPIPAGSIVTSATLQLTCTTSASNGPTFLRPALADWGEGTANAGSPGDAGAPAMPGDATWTYRSYLIQPWGSIGGDFGGTVDGSVAVTPLGNLTISGTGMAARVQSWLANPGTNFGWFMMGDESKTGTVNGFLTREGGGSNLLIVQYNPPATPTRATTWGGVKGVYH